MATEKLTVEFDGATIQSLAQIIAEEFVALEIHGPFKAVDWSEYDDDREWWEEALSEARRTKLETLFSWYLLLPEELRVRIEGEASAMAEVFAEERRSRPSQVTEEMLVAELAANAE